ncbi:MAG: ion channel [Deltaproteobacteria bacterium]
MLEANRSDLSALILSSAKYKMFNFMVSILLLLILLAVLEETKYGYLVLNVLSTIVFLLGVYAVGGSKKRLILLVILGLPWFISEWTFTKSNRTIFMSMLFFILVTVTILEHILKSKEVTADTLYAAVCVYLLLGIMWASIYGVLEYLSPGAVFVGSEGEISEPLSSNVLIYYSFTTLTTLGYGDITSLTPLARIISILEAIIGQLFIVFLVARLVSTYTANALARRSKPES